MCLAVIHAHASRNFEKANMTRKAAFYRVLAGNRFMKAGLKQNALECYRLALPRYINTRWDSIEDHLCAILSSNTSDRNMAVECAHRLLRKCDNQSEINHASFVDNFVQTISRFCTDGESCSVLLPVPLIDAQATRVFCGDRPQAEEVVPVTRNIAWVDLERAAFQVLAGVSSIFHPSHLVSDNETDNQLVRTTPPGERFRVEVSLWNPLKTSLTVQNVTLGICDVRMKKDSENEQPFTERDVINRITLLPETSKKIISVSVLSHRTLRSSTEEFDH
ncbi:hypothetical protein DICVIV_08540 [Dictyocaulus viviparus]|uniref:TPPC8 first Ig-like domain-containing protein n=1 Tax=Dictyocaulus viviparus TaxID=29172 RepID=A0A0D8XSR4_DICVI|nr:hypothetical protein DICVIV_08540 [Dictyocaulus viviparus]